MNPYTINEAERCLSEAAKTTRQQTANRIGISLDSNSLDCLAAERTRLIAEALINQLTKEEDGKPKDTRMSERINKLRDSCKLFEPICENTGPDSEPSKKLLRELLEQGNARLQAEEKAKRAQEASPQSCPLEEVERKPSAAQLNMTVLQSAKTAVDLQAARPIRSNTEAPPNLPEGKDENMETEAASWLAKTVSIARTRMAKSRKSGASIKTNSV